VRIDRLEARLCDIRLEDGDLDLELVPSAAADVQLRSDDGNLTVTLAPGLNAELDVTHGDGRLRVELPAAGLSRSEHRLSGRVGSGSGAGRIRVSTEDGHVTLRQGD